MEYVAIWVIVGVVTCINIICTFITLSRNQSSKKGVTQHYHLDVSSADLLPAEELAAIQQTAREKLQQAVDDSSVHFDRALDAMAAKLSTGAEKQVEQKVVKEFSKYEAQVTQASKSLQGMVATIDKLLQKDVTDARTTLEQTVQAEKERRITSFEKRMTDVVSTYIADSVGGAVNMDAQTTLVVSWLEEHKESIRKDLL